MMPHWPKLVRVPKIFDISAVFSFVSVIIALKFHA